MPSLLQACPSRTPEEFLESARSPSHPSRTCRSAILISERSACMPRQSATKFRSQISRRCCSPAGRIRRNTPETLSTATASSESARISTRNMNTGIALVIPTAFISKCSASLAFTFAPRCH